MPSKGTYFVYMLQCSDQSLYTGYTVNIARRLAQHQSGKGSAYVRSRLPCRMVYQECYTTRRAAMQREAEIKHWPREKKIAFLARSAPMPTDPEKKRRQGK